MDRPLQRIRDIRPDTPWPEHLINLICKTSSPASTASTLNRPGEELTMKLDEIAACICHVALIEIGFVPTYLNVEAVDVRFMKEKERIISLSSEIPSNLRNSASSVISVSYRGICENHNIGNSPSHVGIGNESTDCLNQDGNHLTSPSSSEVIAEKRNKLNEEEVVGVEDEEEEALYMYTNPVDIVMIAQNGNLSLHGHIRKSDTATSTANQTTKTHHLDINIRNFLPSHCPVNNFGVNAVLPGQQWLSQIQLDGSSLSDVLKIKFCKTLLTLVDGISFEPSLSNLSPELLLRIFKFLPTRDIRRIAQISHYMYGVCKLHKTKLRK